MFEAMTEATKNAMGKIGKKGYTAEKINQERIESMEMVMKEIFGDPPTFKSDN